MENICDAVEKLFKDTLGLNAAVIGRVGMERIVQAARQRSGAADDAAYLELLATSPEEFERCLEDLVVPETWFFRDTEPFVLLKQYLCEKCFPSHPNGKVRILSAPCATGEEPYSIAMTLLEAGLQPRQFHLDAADISHRALAAADRAVYGKGAFRQPLTATQEAFFTGSSGERRVVETIVRSVHFHRANLVAPGFLAGRAPYQIIFCKNILIYLTDEAKRQAIANIDRLLAPDGILFTGHAEMGILLQQGFAAVRHPRAFTCTRTAAPPGDKFQISPHHTINGTGADDRAVMSALPASHPMDTAAMHESTAGGRTERKRGEMEPSASDHACFRETGTFGNRSCPELSVLVHCRNCPVYAAAGRRLLDRDIPDGYREEWTARLANIQETGKVETVSVVIFRLREELLALKTVYFQEAVEAAVPHDIPLRTGEVFKGIVNVNGELILCVDLAALLGITGAEGRAAADGKVYPRLVVVSRDGQRFAFIADDVLGVHRFPITNLQELPATVSRSIRALTAGILPWQETTAGLLEEERLFAALGRSLAP